MIEKREREREREEKGEELMRAGRYDFKSVSE